MIKISVGTLLALATNKQCLSPRALQLYEVLHCLTPQLIYLLEVIRTQILGHSSCDTGLSESLTKRPKYFFFWNYYILVWLLELYGLM